MKLFIKNMVCLRCKMVVKEELTKLGLHFVTIDLGEVEVLKSVLNQQIKTVIIELVHYSKEPLIINFSEFLSQKLNHDSHLSAQFKKVTGLTPTHFKQLKDKRRSLLEDV